MGDGLDLLKRGPKYVIQLNAVRMCICCPIIIILIVLSLLVIHWPPLFELKRLYIPALDKSLNNSSNTSIIFELYFKNFQPYSKIYYAPINVTLYDNPNKNHSIAIFTIPEFTQKMDSEKIRSGTANATGFDLEDARREIATKRFKVFHVSLETSVRYQHQKSKRHAYRRGADVKIGDTGAAMGKEILLWARVTFVGLVIMFVCDDIFYVLNVRD